MFTTPEPTRHWGCRVNDRVTWHGERAVLLQNELLQIVILLDKGAEILQFLYKPLDVDFIWRAPNALRNRARFTPAGGSASTPFFDHWSGAWFEVLPNGGPGCEVRGAPLGFYAETINVPWDYQILEDSADRVRIGLWIRTYRTPFLLQKTLELRSGVAALFIEELLTNEGGEPVEFMWGHHPVIGPPFLDDSCRLDAPASRVEVLHDEDGPDYRMGLQQVGRWPIIRDRHDQPLDLRQVLPPAARTMDNCYLSEFEAGWLAVTNTRRQVGFGLAWDASVFKYAWIWEAFGGGIGYPWYGRTYNLGIEPWTSFPCAGLAEASRRGTAGRLGPGDSLAAWLTAAAYTGREAVNHVWRDGTVE
jgi:hypothetical protein